MSWIESITNDHQLRTEGYIDVGDNVMSMTMEWRHTFQRALRLVHDGLDDFLTSKLWGLVPKRLRLKLSPTK